MGGWVGWGTVFYRTNASKNCRVPHVVQGVWLLPNCRQLKRWPQWSCSNKRVHYLVNGSDELLFACVCVRSEVVFGAFTEQGFGNYWSYALTCWNSGLTCVRMSFQFRAAPAIALQRTNGEERAYRRAGEQTACGGQWAAIKIMQENLDEFVDQRFLMCVVEVGKLGCSTRLGGNKQQLCD